MIALTKLLNPPMPSSGGRPPGYELMTSSQAKAEAYKLLQRGLTPPEAHVVDALFVAGVLPEYRLGVSKKGVSRFLHSRILDHLPFDARTVSQKFDEYSLTPGETLLYTLGPVGIEIARERYGVAPPSGFLAYPLERIMHDVVVNEVVLAIGTKAQAHGWEMSWMSKYESTLYRDGRPILEPDAFFILRRAETELPFILEYHNEDKRTRGIRKVRTYEMVCASGDWNAWEVETFPYVLAVYRKGIVGKGYAEGVDEYDGRGRCVFYGRALSSVMSGETDWYNFVSRRKEKVFPWDKESEA